MDDDHNADRIMEDTAYFRRMLDLVPPQSYFDLASKEKLMSQSSGGENLTLKEPNCKQHQKRKQERKRHQENPLHTKSVSQLQEDLANKHSCEFTDIKAKKLRRIESPSQNFNPLTTVSLDLYDKRSRLRAKIEELQAKRKLKSDDKVLKKRLKRQENKMKLKQKKKAIKLGQQNSNLSSMQTFSDHGLSDQSKSLSKTLSASLKPIFNKEGQVVFSKFDFTDSNKKRKHKSELIGKDYKRLLEKIEKRNEKINKTKNKDEVAGRMLQDKYKWKSAFDKAEGEKVKDNPELLKKALKRREKKKEKSKNKWADRETTVKKNQDARQEKRKMNIQARKQTKKDNKLKKAKKKGRIIPGF